MGERTKGIGRILSEISGGMGDIGVFVPLALALAIRNGYDLKGMFLAGGIFYIVAGFYFKIPMPVQPLKAMAAIAIVSGFSYPIMKVAGWEFSLVIFCLLIPGVSRVIEYLFPLPVVRGIQLALGILLVMAGLRMSMGNVPFALVALSLFLASLYFSRALPALLPILVAGTLIGIFRYNGLFPLEGTTGSQPLIHPVTVKGFLLPFTALVVPQIGLTIGNSLMATMQTAKDLFQDRSGKVTFRHLTLSIALGNLVSPFLSGIPMCHGAGGLTAHHRFGGRTNLATAVTGSFFLLLALLPSSLLRPVLLSYPLPFIGIPLVVVGIFHGLLAKEALMRGKYSLSVIVTAGASILLQNMTFGVALGLVAFKFQEMYGNVIAKTVS